MAVQYRTHCTVPKLPVCALKKCTGLADYTSTDEFNVAATNAEAWTAFLAGDHALDAPTGSEYAYCNTNYMLLPLVCEAVSAGRSFGDLMRHDIFTPLCMHDSFVLDRPDAQRPEDTPRELIGAKAVTGYSSTGTGKRRVFEKVENDGWICGDGNVWTSVRIRAHCFGSVTRCDTFQRVK